MEREDPDFEKQQREKQERRDRHLQKQAAARAKMCESIFWALIDEVLQPVDVEKYEHALEAKLERISTSLFKYNRET